MLRKARLQIEDCGDDYLSKHGIHWKFIVELAPWMGGFYERLVVRELYGKPLEVNA